MVSCQPVSTPSPTPPPDPVTLLVEKADSARARDDRETEALALREALERLGQTSPSSVEIPKLRKQCVEAMVKAGGNVSSFELWRRIEKERPAEAAAAKRMSKRAKEMMLRQGAELLTQVEIDEKAGHHQSALCSALAAQELFLAASAEKNDLQAAKALVERLTTKLETPEQQ